MEEAAPVPSTEVRVCQAGTCRRAGSEAVLKEIEELVTGMGPCNVRPSGCLGNCSEAPNAVVVTRGRKSLYSRLDCVEKSATLVQKATGQAPHSDDPAVAQRLTNARRTRIRHQAREESKWNIAMAGLAEQISSSSGEDRWQLQVELSKLLGCAGRWEQGLTLLAEVEAGVHGNMTVMMERARLLGKAGRMDEINAMKKEISRVFCNPEDEYEERQALRQLEKCRSECGSGADDGGLQQRIEDYSLWTVEEITPVSPHSAVYHFKSGDHNRGTPNPKGKRNTVWPKTWHITMLAQVGSNEEGPLPWVERDYTPVSSWHDWEAGKCDILVKIYSTGLGTSWLHTQQPGSTVWLSTPKKTLGVPSLEPDHRLRYALQHRSVLLIVAGTGIVVAAQALQHTSKPAPMPNPNLISNPNLIFQVKTPSLTLILF